MSTPINFSEFSPLSRDQWEAKICKEVGVASLEALQAKVSDRLNFSPLVENAPTSYHARQTGDWVIVHRQFDLENAAKANQDMIKALEGGANGLFIDAKKPVQWEVLLQGIALDYIHLFVKTPTDDPALLNYIREEYPKKLPSVYIIQPTPTRGFAAAGIDGRELADHAVDPERALGCLLAQAYEKLHGGVPASEIWFTLGTRGHYFLDIVQVRALRSLWSFLLKTLSMKEVPAYIYVESTLRNKHSDDVYSNMLRNTAEGMGAVVGGADALCLVPHSIPLEQNDPFGQRISRNAQLIFRYEAHLDKHLDPASGSPFFEKLTHDLADAAWRSFKEIEAVGGWDAYVSSPAYKNLLSEAKKREEDQVASGDLKRVGHNVYRQS
jgi:hypothetical protein